VNAILPVNCRKKVRGRKRRLSRVKHRKSERHRRLLRAVLRRHISHRILEATPVGTRSRACAVAALAVAGTRSRRRQLKGSARVPPLKGGQNSAQGFNPGLGVLTRCALKGHQNAARRVEFISPQALPRSRATFRAHSWVAGYPGGLKPWAEILSPFRGEMLARSLKLTPMGRVPARPAFYVEGT
jgi:hypothetical protein